MNSRSVLSYYKNSNELFKLLKVFNRLPLRIYLIIINEDKDQGDIKGKFCVRDIAEINIDR